MNDECEFCGTRGRVHPAGYEQERRLCPLCSESVPLGVIYGEAPAPLDLMRVVLCVGNALLARLDKLAEPEDGDATP